MNDRFKFRVWDENRKIYPIPTDFLIDYDGNLWEQCTPIDNSDNHLVIEQCTGLRDKNGKLIYEGDILQCIDTKLIVCFNPEIAAFVFVRDFDIELCCGLELAITMRNAMSTDGAKYVSKRYEIIGNVHKEVAE